MEIRLHLDESVTSALAAPLRGRGISVTTSADAALIGATDEQQFAFSTAEDRVLITHDDDFLRLQHTGVHHVGIGYCHPNQVLGR
jgi:predicted nuclease of predicted toxin-antitoxin system